MPDPTQRFTTRVENYVKYRPSYPPGILDVLARRCGLTSSSQIADIGSGTGILTALFLKNGNTVYAVEPNQAMRTAAVAQLISYPHFHSIAATAEATTLPDTSIDLITAGQAFHWFDPARAKREFVRILKPGGWVALIWNERRIDDTPFSQAYERLLRTYAPEYETIHHRHIDRAVFRNFFAPHDFIVETQENAQLFDYAGLQGRLLSSSYVPEEGSPAHAPMLTELRAIFEQHHQSGHVRFDYETHIYCGQLQIIP
jgi:SAM-dependent methyltransferase